MLTLGKGDPPQFASLASPACQTSVQIQLQMTDSVSTCVVSASPFADVFHIFQMLKLNFCYNCGRYQYANNNPNTRSKQ